MQIKNIRFFVYDEGRDFEIVEVNERAFLAAEGEIEYERHTVFENGVDQVCLTKKPHF